MIKSQKYHFRSTLTNEFFDVEADSMHEAVGKAKTILNAKIVMFNDYSFNWSEVHGSVHGHESILSISGNVYIDYNRWMCTVRIFFKEYVENKDVVLQQYTFGLNQLQRGIQWKMD